MNTVAVNHAVAALVAALWVLPAALWQHTAGAIIHYIYLHGPLDWGMWAGLPPATICERITTVAATFWAEAHDPHDDRIVDMSESVHRREQVMGKHVRAQRRTSRTGST